MRETSSPDGASVDTRFGESLKSDPGAGTVPAFSDPPEESSMSSFGEELRRERELRQITLREISESTKINVRYLEALERNDFKHLPGGVFNKGFVRAFAQFIGVDPEAMVNAYLLEESAQGTAGTSGDVFRPPSGNTVHAVSEETPVSESGGSRGIKFAIWSVVALVLVAGVVVAGFYLFSWWRTRPTRSAEAPIEAMPSFDLTDGRNGTGAPSPGTGEETDGTGVDPDETVPVVDAESGAEASPPESNPVPTPAVVEPEATPTGDVTDDPAPAKPDTQRGTLAATLSLVRPTTGRVNCDNRRVEILDGLATGTRMRFECVRFLLIDAADGGAVLLGVGDGEPATLAPDGTPVRGHHVAPPRAHARDTR